MDNKSHGHDTKMVWLKDSEGKSYWLRREVIERFSVTDEVRSDIESLLEDDTSGYGDAYFLLEGVLKHWGTKAGEKGYELNFDLNTDGYVDGADYEIAKQAWYEQYGQKQSTGNAPAPTF